MQSKPERVEKKINKSESQFLKNMSKLIDF